jgi:CheY-like chemotaxis protein
MKRCNLLLVEDNQGDVRLVREALRESGAEFRIKVAGNGHEALNLIGYGQETVPASLPDVILLDLNLPRLSGRELLKILKKDPLYRRIPVLIFSSSQNQEDIQNCYQSRANCYISKPTGFEDYIQVIHRIIEFWFQAATLPVNTANMHS